MNGQNEGREGEDKEGGFFRYGVRLDLRSARESSPSSAGFGSVSWFSRRGWPIRHYCLVAKEARFVYSSLIYELRKIGS